MPIPELHDEVVRLYCEEQLSPGQIGARLLPHRSRDTARRTIATILRRRGVELRPHAEAVRLFYRTEPKRRRGPRYSI